ncbi:MAG TPA: hypothetical protein VLB83_05685 [Candidatus Paceibacterota bacterium]|nr:hypothetical protein [Candidatus Paceibacterota bacterium]
MKFGSPSRLGLGRFPVFPTTRRFYLRFFTKFLAGFGFTAVSAALGFSGLISVPIAALLAFFGWGYANNALWNYESRRSGGPRGLIINPRGPYCSDMWTTVAWLLFGVLFHVYHARMRSGRLEWLS